VNPGIIAAWRVGALNQSRARMARRETKRKPTRKTQASAGSTKEALVFRSIGSTRRHLIRATSRTGSRGRDRGGGGSTPLAGPDRDRRDVKSNRESSARRRCRESSPRACSPTCWLTD